MVDSQFLRTCIGISIVPINDNAQAEQKDFPTCIGLRRTVVVPSKYHIKHPVVNKEGKDPKGNRVKWVIGLGKSISTLSPNRPLEFHSVFPIVSVEAKAGMKKKERNNVQNKNVNVKEESMLELIRKRIGRGVDLSFAIVQKGVSQTIKNLNTEGYYKNLLSRVYQGMENSSNRSIYILNGWYKEYFGEKGYQTKRLEEQLRQMHMQEDKKKP